MKTPSTKATTTITITITNTITNTITTTITNTITNTNTITTTAFRDWTPYALVLVELDEQRGQPSPDRSLRVAANCIDADGNPEKEENVAIGKRVEVTMIDMGDGMALPQFRLSDEPPEHEPWQFPADA